MGDARVASDDQTVILVHGVGRTEPGTLAADSIPMLEGLGHNPRVVEHNWSSTVDEPVGDEGADPAYLARLARAIINSAWIGFDRRGPSSWLAWAGFAVACLTPFFAVLALFAHFAEPDEWWASEQNYADLLARVVLGHPNARESLVEFAGYWALLGSALLTASCLPAIVRPRRLLPLVRRAFLLALWPFFCTLALLALYPVISIIALFAMVTIPILAALAKLLVFENGASIAASFEPVILALALGAVILLLRFAALRWSHHLRLVADVFLYLGDQEYGVRLRGDLAETLHREATRSARQTLVIAAHSLGTVITVDTLVGRQAPTTPRTAPAPRRQPLAVHPRSIRRERRRRKKARLARQRGQELSKRGLPGLAQLELVLVTAGSPLRRLFHRLFPSLYSSPSEYARHFYANATRFRWLNVYRPLDFVGARLSSGTDGIQDKSTRQFRGPLASHVGYWGDPTVGETILAGLASDAIRPDAPADTADLRRGAVHATPVGSRIRRSIGLALILALPCWWLVSDLVMTPIFQREELQRRLDHLDAHGVEGQGRLTATIRAENDSWWSTYLDLCLSIHGVRPRTTLKLNERSLLDEEELENRLDCSAPDRNLRTKMTTSSCRDMDVRVVYDPQQPHRLKLTGFERRTVDVGFMDFIMPLLFAAISLLVAAPYAVMVGVEFQGLNNARRGLVDCLADIWPY